MRSSSGAVLGLTLLAGFAVAAARAEDATQTCDVPAYLLTTESQLPKVADAVKNARPLTILVIGSRSSTIASSEASAYPARLQAALKEKLPNVPINLSVELQTAKTAEEVDAALVKLVEAKKPTLVIWQTGTVDAIRSVDPDDFRGTLAVSAVIFDRGDHKFISEKASEELFWLLGPDALRFYDAITAIEPATASADFANGGYAVMRDGWSDTDNYLIVDCGEVGSLAGGHGHADALSIELAIRGKTMLVDSGTYTYHESRELRDYFRSTAAHNTLVIDGVSSSVPGSAFGWKTRAEAKRKTWISEERFDLFEGSHNGYERLKDPATQTRSILFLKNDYWIMRDVVETTGSHEYSLNFHYARDTKPMVAGKGKWVGDDDHRLFTFGDNGSWQQKESWISNNHGNKANAPFLRFMSSGEGTQEFFTFILPVDTGVAPREVEEISSPAGRAFVIKYSGYTDVFIYNDEPGAIIENGIFDSNFKYSWARLSTGETVPDEFVLIDGDRLRIGGNDIFETSDCRYAAARRVGDELYVKTDLGRSKKSILPSR